MGKREVTEADFRMAHYRDANLIINCKDGTHIDVRPAERKG
jgi:hypothetical protein